MRPAARQLLFFRTMGYTRDPTARTRALVLMKEREGMEAEMNVLIETLTAPGAPGLSGNLVDAEGYPRADINIHTIRTQRHRLACLKTDHKVATDQIEKLLHEALAPPSAEETVEASASGSASNGASGLPTAAVAVADAPGANASGAAGVPSSSALPSAPPRPPFALVDEVAAESPAAKAGLVVGDAIVAFGAISLSSMGTVASAMSALPGCLREHENQPLEVGINRDNSFVDLKLTPCKWSGQGLLGCHVIPAPDTSQVDSRYAPQVAVAVASRAAGSSS